jgi:hypothetical protein
VASDGVGPTGPPITNSALRSFGARTLGVEGLYNGATVIPRRWNAPVLNPSLALGWTTMLSQHLTLEPILDEGHSARWNEEDTSPSDARFGTMRVLHAVGDDPYGHQGTPNSQPETDLS